MSRLLPAFLVLAIAGAAPVPAQIGFQPSSSPFRDIRNGRWLEAQGGRIFGGGGPLRVGPRDGAFTGLRLDLRSNHSVQLSLGAWVGMTERFIVHADDSVATRTKGPVDQRLIGGEFGIQLNLTGGKRWHGLAPYFGVGLGLVNGKKPPARADTSGYTFGTKTYFAPNLGTRVFLGQRVFVKAEARAYFWNLKYPLAYGDEPEKQPGTPDHPNAVNPSGKSGEYVMTPALIFGFGWAF